MASGERNSEALVWNEASPQVKTLSDASGNGKQELLAMLNSGMPAREDRPGQEMHSKPFV